MDSKRATKKIWPVPKPTTRLTGESEENQQQDEDDFGIAWEVLDTARVIYERDVSLSSPARASKLVDVYCLLGDLSMENGTRTFNFLDRNI